MTTFQKVTKVVQFFLDTRQNVPRVPHVGQFLLDGKYVKLVCLIHVSVRHRNDVYKRSFLLMYQLRHRNDVSSWSVTFQLATKMD